MYVSSRVLFGGGGGGGGGEGHLPCKFPPTSMGFEKNCSECTMQNVHLTYFQNFSGRGGEGGGGGGGGVLVMLAR